MVTVAGIGIAEGQRTHQWVTTMKFGLRACIQVERFAAREPGPASRVGMTAKTDATRSQEVERIEYIPGWKDEVSWKQASGVQRLWN